MDDTSLSPFRSIPLKGPYSIPLRSLYSKSFDNLVMAGRNISVTHVALSTTRVMATCATLGQAIGTAVAYCVKHRITPANLANTKERLRDYQQLLLRQDQAILGVVNVDQQDLARQAVVKASSESTGFEAKKVIDGVNRDIQDGHSHQWRGDLRSGDAHIELRWSAPRTIRTVELTFDTGLNRHLRLSGENGTMKRQVRGPQPETICDYTLEYLLGEKVIKTEEVRDNFLRKIVHETESIRVDRIRLTAKKTHGDPYARVFEIRCYA